MKHLIRAVLFLLGVLLAYLAHDAFGGRYYTSARTSRTLDGMTGTVTAYGGVETQFR